MSDLVQGTPDWLQARCGSLGASQVADALARTKTGWGASRANAKARIITERLTGRPVETFTTAAMMRGTELEPVARAMYSFQTGHDVSEIGIVFHPVIKGTHCSPDGLIADHGMVEIKCCGAARHIEILTGSPPEDRYVKQCLWQLACTGRSWVDLAYFNPDLPEAMQLHVTRIERDDAIITAMEDEVAAFLSEVAETLAELTARYTIKEAA